MKILITYLLLFFFTPLLSFPLYADEGEGGSAKIGPNQAITAVDPKQGFQLSQPAVRTLEIQFQKVNTPPPLSIPKTALVFFQNDVGIYRFRNPWYKLVEVQILSKTPSQVLVRAKDLNPSDQIVTRGAPLLRVADLGRESP